jgi:hypothetical protein
MSFSLRDLALAAPLQLSILAGIPAAGMASQAPDRTAELMQLPVAGMIIGALIIAANGAIGHGISRAAQNRLATEVLHP